MNFNEVVQIVSRASTKSEALRVTYDILSGKYRGGRVKTYALFWRLFETKVETLWGRSGFLHCTKINRLLRELLIASGKFTSDDILTRWTFVWFFSPHQYVRVRVADDQWVSVDIWAKAYGIEFGDYARGFH